MMKTSLIVFLLDAVFTYPTYLPCGDKVPDRSTIMRVEPRLDEDLLFTVFVNDVVVECNSEEWKEVGPEDEISYSQPTLSGQFLVDISGAEFSAGSASCSTRLINTEESQLINFILDDDLKVSVTLYLATAPEQTTVRYSESCVYKFRFTEEVLDHSEYEYEVEPEENASGEKTNESASTSSETAFGFISALEGVIAFLIGVSALFVLLLIFGKAGEKLS
eukprot:maker-scaffold_15-snap-gene-0.29-mRNA-1 protein AED:0.00 eAED:0.00 QI:65/1/1/1/1/1/2/133/219